MRIVIDLQGAQSGSRQRGIGRYTLSLAQAMVRNRGEHEILLALNGMFPETIESIRTAFDDILPQENIRVWSAVGPVHAMDPANLWRRHAAELLREKFLQSLNPDIVHISSLFEGFDDNSVHSIGLTGFDLPTAATFYDVIPLIQSEVYLKPNPYFEQLYMEKLAYLRRANIFLAISESSRQESIEHVGANEQWAVNIGAAADSHFKKIDITPIDEMRVRAKFGLDRKILMYSGATDERKNHLRLIKAFSLLPKHLKNRYQLAFVGGLPPPHRAKFEAWTKFCGLTGSDVVITGRVTDDEMIQLYNICDLFVFPSWHEGFGLPALEAMSCGAPVIGSNTTSIPEVIGVDDALFNPFSEKDIAKKIEFVLNNDAFRSSLAQHGLEQAKKFSWDESAKTTLKTFEQWFDKHPKISFPGLTSYAESPTSEVPWLVENITNLANAPDDDSEWLKIAGSITKNHSSMKKKQLFVDISELVQRDARTGVQRVVRGILSELLKNQPEGFTVEPVYATTSEAGYRYARKYMAKFLDTGVFAEEDPYIEYSHSDIFLGLDLSFIILHQTSFFDELKILGVRTYFVLYDLLPVLMSGYFPSHIPEVYERWLAKLAQADGVLCISKSVMTEMVDCLSIIGSARSRPLKLNWFHLGADVSESAPTKGLPIASESVIGKIKSRPSFLMVGTVEPRKGQAQVLAAFEELWNAGVEVNLVIVGKHGWNIDYLIEMLRMHEERGHRLFWLEGVTDEYLEKLYSACACLIAASEGEGFGLPLIEAAQHEIPIIARDIPVFREVVGSGAFYFSGKEPSAISGAVRSWLSLNARTAAPSSKSVSWLTWAESTRNLLDIVLNGKAEKCWLPDGNHQFWGASNRMGTQVGVRDGRNMVSTGVEGYLIFGPYIELPSGPYIVNIFGEFLGSGSYTSSADVAIGSGQVVLASSPLVSGDPRRCLVSLKVDLKVPCTDFEVRVSVGPKVNLNISLIQISKATDSLLTIPSESSSILEVG